MLDWRRTGAHDQPMLRDGTAPTDVGRVVQKSGGETPRHRWENFPPSGLSQGTGKRKKKIDLVSPLGFHLAYCCHTWFGSVTTCHQTSFDWESNPH